MSPITITPHLPCGGCAHSAVCSIRPLLPTSIDVADPPNEALRVTVEVRVECSHLLPLADVRVAERTENLAEVVEAAAPATHRASSAVREALAGAEAEFDRRALPASVVESGADHSLSIPGAQPVARPDRPIDQFPKRARRPLGPPRATCEPGCGTSFAETEISAHRRTCDAYQAARADKVRVVGRAEPAPPTESALEAVAQAVREHAAFAERRTEAARAAADRAWAERHPGEQRPLTANQERAVAAIREADGDVAAAARALGLGDTPARVWSVVQNLRDSGRLPIDVAQLLDRHRRQRPRQA